MSTREQIINRTADEDRTIAVWRAVMKQVDHAVERFPILDPASLATEAGWRLDRLRLEGSLGAARLEHVTRVAVQWAVFDQLRRRRHDVTAEDVDDRRALLDADGQGQARMERARVANALDTMSPDDIGLFEIGPRKRLRRALG